ncbi:MAG TPA: hypothetical protein VGM84_05090 [Steroidobacteraceae bacterium]
MFTDRYSSPATFPTGRLVGQLLADPLHLHPVGQVSGGVAARRAAAPDHHEFLAGEISHGLLLLGAMVRPVRAHTGAPFCYVPASLGAIASPRIITSATRTR